MSRWAGRGVSAQHPCLPTSRSGERQQHSTNSQTGTKVLEKWHRGSSYCLNSGEKPGVLLDSKEERR